MTLSVHEVRAGYVPDADILNSLSITVQPGEIVTILGPNGSGKSTLLKTVVGQLRPRAGRVVADGRDLAGIPVHRRIRDCGVAYVPQLDNIFGPLTIRENLELGGQFVAPATRRTRLEQLLEHYPNLGRKAGARADSLSGGERQMLALARALMPGPRHLLLDEPSAGLSPLMMDELFAHIRRIRDREGVSVLMVEQNAAESLEVSDRAYVLVMGRVHREGTAREILEDETVGQLYLGAGPVH